jgi:hypothetical protein
MSQSITLPCVRNGVTVTLSKFGEYKLSSKAIKREKSQFEKFTGVNDANEIRILLLQDKTCAKRFYDFYYIDNRTQEVIGCSEYRKLDSFFETTVFGYKPIVRSNEIDNVFANLPCEINDTSKKLLGLFFSFI